GTVTFHRLYQLVRQKGGVEDRTFEIEFLDPGASCAIQVTFTPAASGARAGLLAVADNAAASPQSVALSGTGASGAPADILIAPATGGSTAATVAAGQTATFSLDATTTNNFVGTVALACAGAPTGAVCTPTPASFAAGGLPQPVSVIVTTTPALAAAPWGVLLLFGSGLLLAFRTRRHVVLVPVALALALAGCSSGRLGPATPPGTYILTLAANSAGAQIGSAQLTLTVQ
ncbi:MAG: hypothetical protein ACRD1E_07045, partial [Terriglobales bacterium]